MRPAPVPFEPFLVCFLFGHHLYHRHPAVTDAAIVHFRRQFLSLKSQKGLERHSRGWPLMCSSVCEKHHRGTVCYGAPGKRFESPFELRTESRLPEWPILLYSQGKMRLKCHIPVALINA